MGPRKNSLSQGTKKSPRKKFPKNLFSKAIISPKKISQSPGTKKSPRKKFPQKETVDDYCGFSHSQVENLINAVEQHPCIYNSSLKEYKDKGVVTEAWATISSSFPSVSLKELQTKWKSLRYRYIRSRKAENSRDPSDSGAKTNKGSQQKWVFHDQMSFMNRHIKERMRGI